MFNSDGTLNEKCYNGNILGRIFLKDFKEE
jgi:hypothetical protein